jgi:uncharacterized protein YgiM (DUF1202 family)
MTNQVNRGRRVFSSAGYGVSSLALAGLVLSGCGTVANLNPFNSLETKYGNQSDACYYARKPLIDSGNVFAQSMITGAAVGGATGAVAGALIAKDKVEGAVVGGVVGAAAGAAAGYLHAKQEQAKTRAELIASIDTDAARDNRQLVTGSNAIAMLTRCRQDQIAVVERNYRSKAISASEARQQLQGIQSAVHDDNALISDVLGEADNRSNTYIQARADSGAPVGGGGHYTPTRPGQYISTVNANVRGGPSTGGKVVDTLHTGEAITVVADAGNGWVSISHNGVTGYVSRRLLAEPNSATARRAEERGGATQANAAPTAPAQPPAEAAPPAGTPSTAPAPSVATAPPPEAPPPAAAPPEAPPPPPVVANAEPPEHTAAVGDSGTATFVRTTEEAQRREEAHKQVESELQTRINNLPNSG